MKRILLTGATGFIGQNVLSELSVKKYEIFALYRAGSQQSIIEKFSNVHWLKYDLLELDLFSSFPNDIDTVIHLAGMAHQKISNGHEKDLIKKVNVDSTIQLAKKAANSGVHQFIFVSTAKVYGEKILYTANDKVIVFDMNSSCLPNDDYAKSKYCAEQELIKICRESPMSYTIFRPPLLFGQGVKANFLKLVQLVDKGVPLPFARIINNRSFMYVNNFADAIVKSIDNTMLLDKCFPIKDIDVSTAVLIKTIAKALEKPIRLMPVNHSVLNLCFKLIRRKEQYEKLTCSFIVDDSIFRNTLSWVPPTSFVDSIKQTVDWYKTRKQ